LEGCKTFKPFLEDIINVARPERIHIELQEIVVPQTNINFRKNLVKRKVDLWRLVTLTPKKDNIRLLGFLEMLNDETVIQKKIRRIEIICIEDIIRLSDKCFPLFKTKSHYIFGQNIVISNCFPTLNNTRQLSHVSIRDLEFEVKSLRNTKAFIGSGNLCESVVSNIRDEDLSSSLPF